MPDLIIVIHKMLAIGTAYIDELKKDVDEHPIDLDYRETYGSFKKQYLYWMEVLKPTINQN